MSKKVSSIGAKLQRTFSSQVTRAEAGQHCAHLEKFIESTHAFNGIHKYPYLAIYHVTSLGDLITNTKYDSLLKERGLWMYKMPEPEEQGYYGTCDLEIIRELRENRKAPFVSHICREPTIMELPRKDLAGGYDFGGSTLEACLLVTVYSLIQQLLQLKLSRDEDNTKIDINRLTGFELRNSHWQSALDMLDKLLRKTPSLEFCVLYWLPALDDGRHAKEKSEQLMNLLYKYKQMNSLRLVFVTWGESRLLKERVEKQNLYRVEIEMEEVKYPDLLNWRNEDRDPFRRGNVGYFGQT